MASAPKGSIVNYDPELGRPPNSVAIEIGPAGQRKASRKNRKGSRKSRKCGLFKNRKASRKNSRKNRKASRKH